MARKGLSPLLSTSAVFLAVGLATSLSHNAMPQDRIDRRMKKDEPPHRMMPLLNHYVQSFCGLYTRVATRLKVDRSYVSRVARGERHSEEIEQALSTEFSRITTELR